MTEPAGNNGKAPSVLAAAALQAERALVLETLIKRVRVVIPENGGRSEPVICSFDSTHEQMADEFAVFVKRWCPSVEVAFGNHLLSPATHRVMHVAWNYGGEASP